MAMQQRHMTHFGLALMLVLGLVACNKPTEPAKTTTAAPAAVVDTFTVLATTDLKDAQPLEKMVEDATGVKLRFKYGGTMESTEAVQTGQANTDAAWFANAKYLLSDPQGQARVKLQEKIMLSPVVVGVSQSQAQVLGWNKPEVASKITWNAIAKAAQSGQLKYALSNPATSNQGFMALMGVVASAAQKSEALTAADVDRAAISGFIKGYKLVGDNSSYLSEKFIEQQNTGVNAFINYENWLLSLNQSGKLKEPLTLIYPFEGVATADYPLMLLNDAKREQYLKVVAYLKGDTAQTWLAKTTLRRPVNGEVAKAQASLFPQDSMLVELPFSERVYAPVFFQLPGLQKDAASGKGLTAQAADSEAKQKVLGQVRDFADGLQMNGGTALCDAVFQALVNMNEERQKNPGYQYSVVAFTDGEVNKGRDMAQFKAAYAALPEDVRAIPVFMVLFGEANEAALKELVATTGGRVFDARKASLYSVFKYIRAYQ
jgi:hypothetical protein